MAIDKTVIDSNRIITPKVITEAVTIGDSTVTRIVQTVTNEPGDIPTSIALTPWMTACQVQLTEALADFENILISGEYNTADSILETLTRIFFTPVEKIKLSNIAENANNYVHPSTHSADMITESAPNRLWFTQARRDHLDTVQPYANNYIHPSTHPASMITGLIGGDGYLLPELIKSSGVHRINVRQTILSGWSNYNNLHGGPLVTDYPDAPSLTLVNDLGTNDSIRLNVTQGQPFIATIANGFSTYYGNGDSITYLEAGYVQSTSTIGQGFTDGSNIYLVLHGDGTLTWSNENDKPWFNVARGASYSASNATAVLSIAQAKYYTTGDSIRDLIPITPGKYYHHNFGIMGAINYEVTIPNRFFTNKIVVQTLIKQPASTVWDVVGLFTTKKQISAYISINDNDINIEINNVLNCEFAINIMRLY